MMLRNRSLPKSTGTKPGFCVFNKRGACRAAIGEPGRLFGKAHGKPTSDDLRQHFLDVDSVKQLIVAALAVPLLSCGVAHASAVQAFGISLPSDIPSETREHTGSEPAQAIEGFDESDFVRSAEHALAELLGGAPGPQPRLDAFPLHLHNSRCSPDAIWVSTNVAPFSSTNTPWIVNTPPTGDGSGTPAVDNTLGPDLSPESPDVLVPRAPRPDVTVPNQPAEPPKTPAVPPPVPKKNKPCPVQPMPIDPKQAPPCWLLSRIDAERRARAMQVAGPSNEGARASFVSLSLPLGSGDAPTLARLEMPQDLATPGSSSQAVLRPAASPLPPDFQFPALPSLKQLQYEQYKMGNGATVFLVPDHSTPLVQGAIIMPGGQYASPADKVGMASLAAAVQRTGGSESVPQQELNDRLEQMAASIETNASPLSTSISFESLSADVDDILGLTADVLLHPAIPQEGLDLFKLQAMNIILHQNDDKSTVADRKIRQIMYGADSIYARRATQESLTSIEREDVLQWLSQWQRADTARIIILGDFNEIEMRGLLAKHLGSWTSSSTAPVVPSQQIPDFSSAGRVYFVNQPGVSQAAVAMAEPGITLADPDSYALDMLAATLNGFGGKLFDEVRSKEGLAYSVSAGWDAPADHPGLFMASSETASPAQLIASIRGVLQRTLREPPTAAELQEEKDKRENQFVFNFKDKADQAQRLAVYSILGLPEDFLYLYQDGIRAVTPETLLKAAQAHLHPEQQVIVVVGDAAAFKPQLTKLGLEIVDTGMPV